MQRRLYMNSYKIQLTSVCDCNFILIIYALLDIITAKDIKVEILQHENSKEGVGIDYLIPILNMEASAMRNRILNGNRQNITLKYTFTSSS